MQRRTSFALIFALALMTGLQSSARPVPPEGFLGSYRWNDRNPAFGGLSAIEMQDTLHAVLLTDKGQLVRAEFTRNPAGKMTKATVKAIAPLHDDAGRLLTKKHRDSEGMDLAADGSLVISFEGKPARFTRYTGRWDGPAQPLPSTEGFAKLPRNAAFEAVTRDDKGRVYAIPEGFPESQETLPVFRLQADTWDQNLSIPWRDSFLPVAADIGPDGRLYLLERKFEQPLAFASRLRRFTVGPNSLTDEQILFETEPGLHDNLEGLSVWRDDQGRLRATMVSDDNFQWFLRTDLVEYVLPD